MKSGESENVVAWMITIRGVEVYDRMAEAGELRLDDEILDNGVRWYHVVEEITQVVNVPPSLVSTRHIGTFR